MTQADHKRRLARLEEISRLSRRELSLSTVKFWEPEVEADEAAIRAHELELLPDLEVGSVVLLVIQPSGKVPVRFPLGEPSPVRAERWRRAAPALAEVFREREAEIEE